ncbi:MAG: DUF4340 domain-containing protein [bacterium]
MKKNTFIILGIFFILLGYYYFFEAKKTKTELINKNLFTVKQENIDKFSIKHSNISIICKKEKDQWLLINPLKDNADINMVKKILEEITNLSYHKKISKKEIKKTSLFGFSNPQLEFNFWNKGTKETLFIGENTPIEGYVYVKKNKDENIYLVGEEILFTLRQDAISLRNKKVLFFKKDDVVRIKIEYPKKNIEAIKKTEKKWDLISPLQTKADKYIIDNVFTTLENLEIMEFIPYSENNFKYYNLDKPKIKITLELKGNEVKKISFGLREKLESAPSYAPPEVQKQKIKNKEVYAKVEGKEEIFAVNEWTIEELTKDAEIFQDKRVFDFEFEEIHKICLIYPNQEFICTKKNKEWYLEKPIKTLADKYVIEEIIRNVSNIKAKKNIENVNNLSKYGFDKQIILEGKNQKIVFFLGNKKDEKVVYGLNEAEKNKVFTMEEWTTTNLTNKDLISLREKNVFNFKKENVNSFKIKYLSKTISGIKKNEKIWQIKINRKKRNIESATINLFLDSLSNLRTNEFIKDNLKPLSEYQLDSAKIVISLEIGKKQQKVILIGKPTENKESYYAQIEKIKEIFCLPFYQIKDIEKKIIDLEKN